MDPEKEAEGLTIQRVPILRGLNILLLAFVVACTGPARPSRPEVPSPPEDCTSMPSPTGGDDTSTINAWIASLSSGSCGYVRPSEEGERTTYQVEGTVLIAGKTGIRLFLDGAVFQASGVIGDIDPGPKTGWRSHVAIRDSTNISLRGLHVQGAWDCTFDSSYEGEAAFFVEDSNRIVLTDVSASGIAGDGVEMADVRRLTISRSDFDCTGRMGVSVIRTSSDVTVTRSTFDQIPRSVFDVELTADWYTAERIAFTHNTVLNHGLLFFAGGGLGSKSGITLASNTSSVKPIRIKYVGSDLTLRDNRGVGVADTPIVQATGGSGLVLQGNLQNFQTASRKNPAPPAVELQDWCTAQASGNTFTGAVAVFEGTPNAGCAWEGGTTIRPEDPSPSDPAK